jgi:hypothetical protein
MIEAGYLDFLLILKIAVRLSVCGFYRQMKPAI